MEGYFAFSCALGVQPAGSRVLASTRHSCSRPAQRSSSRRCRLQMSVSGEVDAPELPESVKEKIESQVGSASVVLYMKGDPSEPKCGFSRRAASLLDTLGAQYTTFNVLADEDIRQGIKIFSEWPTIPQLYIDGEFIGGTDIMVAMYYSGELTKVLADADAI